MMIQIQVGFEYITGYNNGSAVYANPSIANPVAQLLQTYDRGLNNRFMVISNLIISSIFT